MTPIFAKVKAKRREKGEGTYLVVGLPVRPLRSVPLLAARDLYAKSSAESEFQRRLSRLWLAFCKIRLAGVRGGADVLSTETISNTLFVPTHMSIQSLTTTKVRPVSQDELLAFLLDARSYPHRPKQVRLKQTHSSYVLLAAPYAYKIKKPVNFGFLDFSTLEKRRYFSEREVELNRRLCPDVHLGVVPISLRAGRLTFGPGDEIVEYAVKMRQLEDRYFFLRLLKKDQIGTKDLDRIVSVLKAFYEAQKPTEEIAAWGRIESLKISTDENFRQTEDFIGFTISRPAFETIRFYTDNFYTRNAGLFESRIRGQRIRDCHGDLHLEHIHIAPTRLSIYDCIEFNDRFRCIDIANDVAFLAMDLDYHHRPDLSKEFTARIADALGDQADVAPDGFLQMLSRLCPR